MTINLPIRQPVLDKGWVQLEECMGGDAAVIRGARICYQSEARTPQADERLIRRLMASEPKHNTVFEHAVFRFGIKCPLFVARQWMRHRIACVAGDTLVYFDLPGAINQGKRRRYAVTVADLYRRWQEGTEHAIGKKKPLFLDRVNPNQTYSIPELAKLVERREETLREYVREGRLQAIRIAQKTPTDCAILVPGQAWHDYASKSHTTRVPMRERIMQMQLRMCNESTGEIEHTQIADIRATGLKPVFRVTLENGYQLKMTQDHLCLTERGWLTLEQATELKCNDGVVSWRKDSPAFAVNGQPAYTDQDWLAQRRAEGLGVQEIAAPVRLLRAFSRVRRIEFAGIEPTYDIQVTGPYHNYIANGFIVHNSYNERSLRYCLADREYYIPQGDLPQREAYIAHMEASFDLYEQLVAAGWKREQARAILGTAVYTEFVWTVNAWSLMNWLQKRMVKGAQWEHRQYAETILRMFHEVMPITASAFEESVLKQ
ncbi:MAG: hypothetical protein GX552_17425 [Chloroflexi bacterium]|nr:hypothetical protein [Chloroflexota bacterium]